MTQYIKYLSGVALMVLFLYVFSANQALALEVIEVQPAETISYQEPLNVSSSLSATLSSYFFQGTHIGSLDGTGGVLFANGTIINISRTEKNNGPVPVTLGDDLRVDGEIWRGTAKGASDNMPLKISDTMVPTMDDINDLGDPGRRWQDLYLSGTLHGNNAIISGTLTGNNATFTGDVTVEGNLVVNGTENNISNSMSDTHSSFSEIVTIGWGNVNRISFLEDRVLKRIDVKSRENVDTGNEMDVEVRDKDGNVLASAVVLGDSNYGYWSGEVSLLTTIYPINIYIREQPAVATADDVNITLHFGN